MTRQQLESDIHDENFDPEEDLAQLEHYQLNGNKPILMPDLSRLKQDAGGWSHTGKDGLSIFGP